MTAFLRVYCIVELFSRMNTTQTGKIGHLHNSLKSFYPAVKQGHQNLELSQAAIISVY
jgi:hypothetical protein